MVQQGQEQEGTGQGKQILQDSREGGRMAQALRGAKDKELAG